MAGLTPRLCAGTGAQPRRRRDPSCRCRGPSRCRRAGRGNLADRARQDAAHEERGTCCATRAAKSWRSPPEVDALIERGGVAGGLAGHRRGRRRPVARLPPSTFGADRQRPSRLRRDDGWPGSCSCMRPGTPSSWMRGTVPLTGSRRHPGLLHLHPGGDRARLIILRRLTAPRPGRSCRTGSAPAVTAPRSRSKPAATAALGRYRWQLASASR
jgi:hypothetical protein